MIYLQTQGGLANRLRSIASAVKLAAEYNTPVTIYWNISDELHCSFYDMFVLNDSNIRVYEKKVGTTLKILSKIKNLIAPSRYIDIDNEENRAKFISDFKNVPNKDYYIHSYSNFYNAHNYDFIRPVDTVNTRVNNLIGDINRTNLVGIQIRRTDNAESKAHSPTEMFMQNMTSELTANPNTIFYLATDDINVRCEIAERFPDKVIYNKNGSISRKTKSGMTDAMTDFIALSRCHRIYGSYWSSFCEVASDIGKNELIVVKK